VAVCHHDIQKKARQFHDKPAGQSSPQGIAKAIKHIVARFIALVINIAI
jgi:hypothetical protein